MARQSEEARKRAQQIRAEVLSKLEDRSGDGGLKAEIAELKALVVAQQRSIDHLVQAVEVLTRRLQSPESPVLSSPRPLRATKRQILERIRDLRAQDLSFSQICEEFQRTSVPTLSGDGQWSKGTLWNLWKNHRHQLDDASR